MRRRLTGKIVDLSSAGEAEKPTPSTGIRESEHSISIRNLSNTVAVVTPEESVWEVCEDLTDEARFLLQFIFSHVSEEESTGTRVK